MNSLLSFLKELIPIIFISALAFIGYAIANLFIVIDFVSEDGEILWGAVFFGVLCLVGGYLIYKAAEKLWVK